SIGTIPDEQAYYDWSRFFAQGRFAIPLSELSAIAEGAFAVSPNTIAPQINITWYDGDNSTILNDLYLTASYAGMPVENLTVALDGKVLGNTDSSGSLAAFNIRGQMVEVYGQSGNNTYFTQVVFSGTQINNYYLLVSCTAELISKYAPLGIVEFGFLGPSTHATIICGNNTPVIVPIVNSKAFVNITGYPVLIFLNSPNPTNVTINGTYIGTTQGASPIVFDGFWQCHLYASLRDSFGNPASGVKIIIDGRDTGMSTNSDGNLTLETTLTQGIHSLTGVREGIRINSFMVGVAEVEGDYMLVPHWAPGYPALLALLSFVSLDGIATLLMLWLSTGCIYLISRRRWGFIAGSFSASVWMFTPLVLSMVYSRYMADFPTTAFATFGLFFLDRATSTDRTFLRRSIELVVAGLLFGLAVTMRYSTVVVLACPAFIMSRWIISCFFKKRKFAFDSRALKEVLTLTVCFCIGALLIGIPLMIYNNTYYGGPLRAGYQLPQSVIVGSPTNSQSNSAETEDNQDFFTSRFNIDSSVFKSIPRKVSFLFFMCPVLFLGAMAFFRKRDYFTISLAVWSLSIIIIYFSQSWACQWSSDDARSLEDVRYFLPAVPPMAIVSGSILNYRRQDEGLSTTSSFHNADINTDFKEEKEAKRKFSQKFEVVDVEKRNATILFIVVLLLLLSSIFIAGYAIGKQLERKGGPKNYDSTTQGKPASYIDVTPQILLAEPLRYNGALVHLQAMSTYGKLNENLYFLTPDKRLQLHIESPAQVYIPAEQFDIYGIFRPAFSNKDISPSGEWEINIRASSTDKIVSSSTSQHGDIGNISIFHPPPDQPIPSTNITFVAKSDPPAVNGTFYFNSVEANTFPGKYPGDFVAFFTPPEGLLTVKIVAYINGTKVEKTQQYLVLEGGPAPPGEGGTELGGKPDDFTTTDLFFRPQLAPSLLFIIVAMVLCLWLVLKKPL
ncbi:MAG: hypothetical protein QW728_02890, partial [Thermoplasmata archaeon]